MSDTADATPIDAAPAAEPSAPAAPVAPVDSAAASGGGEAPVEESVLDTELPNGMRQFDRAYVERVRAEAAANRTKARELEQQLAERAEREQRYAAFEAYSDEDMQVWTKMASDWQENPQTAAQTMQLIAQRVLGDPESTPEERADAQAVLDNSAVSDAADGLTEDKIREIARQETAAERAEREREEAVRGVFKQLADAGYEEGSPQAFQVLWFANNQTNGDIAEAIKLHQAEEQKVIDRYVESMSKGGTPVRLPNTGEAGSPAPTQPKDIREAKRMADAWLDERRSSVG